MSELKNKPGGSIDRLWNEEILEMLGSAEFGPALKPIITKTGVTHWWLDEDYEIELYNGNLAVIPRGTITNWASVPPYLRWALSNTDPLIIIPALVHDALVQEWNTFNVARIYDNEGNLLPQMKWSEAAEQFRWMISKYRGARVKTKAMMAYTAVSLHGKIQGYD